MSLVVHSADIAAAIKEAVAQIAAENGGLDMLAVNNGHCETVAVTAIDLLKAAGCLAGVPEEELPEDAETLSFCIEDDRTGILRFDRKLLRRHWPAVKPPAPLTWNDVEALEMTDTRHAWIIFSQRHYDADAPDGVDNFFDLPLFRRNLGGAVISLRPGSVPSLMADPWWRETFRLHQDFVAWLDGGKRSAFAPSIPEMAP